MRLTYAAMALLGLCFFVSLRCADAGQPTSGASSIDFVDDVQPILRRHCHRCHGTQNQEAGLQLNRRGSTFGEADSGETIVVRHEPESSLLIKRLVDEDYGDLMPLDGQPLSEVEIGVLREWIARGAAWPDAQAEAVHWSYRPIVRPQVPIVIDAAATPIDQFVARRLQQHGLKPAPPADRARLIRRVSLALVGLPPTVREVDAFLNDQSENAYEKVVDRLLSSDRYGERWAVPWLDLARYADSNGFQADQLRDNWAYRDWVIRAFNSDMPFDQFVTEQIAGDLLPGATTEQRIATGFHRMTTCNVEAGVHPEANRVNQIVDRVNTTATVFLGTTLECAQCHDHKYDPFTQQDYYQIFAYFNNTPLEVKKTAGVTWDFYGPVMQLPLDQEAQSHSQTLTGELETLRQSRQEIANTLDREFNDWIERIRRASEAGADCDKDTIALASAKKLKPADRRKLRSIFESRHVQLRDLDRRMAAVRKQLDELTPDTTLVMVEMESPRATHVLKRGDYESPGQQVHPATPQALPKATGIPETGDRLELARWLTCDENPLLARVTVNRWWAAFFQSGIVTTLEDFGSQAEEPSHPHLLDWLAAELIESGWSMKHVHKQIVMSATFQQSARMTPDMLAKDPGNRWLARGPRMRLAAELIRDNALAISGLLADKMYGPPIMPYQPDNVWRSVGRNQPKWKSAEGEDRFRRGVYVVWKRAAPYPSFINFDAPDRSSCTVSRPRTNTPLQALTLLNDPAYAEMALAYADRILAESEESTDEGRIRYAVRLAVARNAEPEEVAILKRLLDDERRWLATRDQAVEARVQVPYAGMRWKCDDTNELAAWFAVANALLNLDETMSQ